MNSDTIHIRVSIETKGKLKELAEKEGRTISNLVNRIIEQQIKEKQ